MKSILSFVTRLLHLLKANMNLQYVTGIFDMLSNLTLYLFKPEHHMSELMKKSSKDHIIKVLKRKFEVLVMFY